MGLQQLRISRELDERRHVIGEVSVFAPTALKGKVLLDAADSVGDTTTTIVNASQAAARKYTIPDGGADANFVLSEGAATINGIKTFGSALELGTVGITGSDIIIQSLNPMTFQLNDVDALQLDNAAIASFAGATDVAGNDVFIETEDAGATPTAARTGGLLNIKTGDGAAAVTTVAAGAGGALSLVSGAGGVQSGAGASGVGGAGGAVAVTGGAGGTTDNTGTDAAGDGGDVTVTAGVGGAASGAGVSDGGIGGNVVIVPGGGGAATGGGTAGITGRIINRGLLVVNQPAPTTATATATLTDAQMLGGILEATPGAIVTYTTRTGTQIEAALLAAGIATDDAFDLTIINLGAATEIITLAGGTGVSIVGSATIDDPGADINSSGTFRFRRSAANTFIAYRIN